jgi:hypothetical protein
MADNTWTILLVTASVVLIALFLHKCDVSVKCGAPNPIGMENFGEVPTSNNLKWLPRPAYCRHGRTTCEQCVHSFNYL